MIIPEGFAVIRFIFSCAGVTDQMGTTLGVQADPGITPTEIADHAYSDFAESFLIPSSAFLTNWTFVGTSVTKTVAGAPVLGEHLAAMNGSGGTDGVVVNTGYLVRKNTARGGRKGRGRMFVPPFNLTEPDVSEAGVLTSGYRAGEQTSWETFLGKLAADGVFPWLMHDDPADTPNAITGLTVQGLVATQRRRLR